MAAPAGADAPAVATVQVRPTPAQTITGFGASGAWWPNDADGFSTTTRAQIARLLFDRSAGLGLSIYRYNIGGGGAGVQAGARAPKSFLTAPGRYDWSDDPGGTAFLRLAALIRSVAAALAARAPGTTVSADESTSAAALRAGFDRWIDSGVGTVSFHGYDYPTSAALRSLSGLVRSRTSARLEMTEVCCSTGAGFTRGYNPGMIGGLWLADTIWRNLSAGGASSFSWWTALSPELGCTPSADPACPSASDGSGWNDGLLYYDPDFRSNGNQSIYFTRRYWVLANFSRYIRPGAVHYRVSNVPAGVHVLAFLRNTWRFVLINDATASRPVGVRLVRPTGGHAYGQPSAYTTSATSDLAPAPAPALDPATRTVTTTLPARSVTTMIVPW
jgi:hypothetical protein